MKRKGFIAALSAFLTTPLPASIPESWLASMRRKGFRVRAGEGRIHGPLTLQGVNSNVLTVKISGKDTGGDLAIFEQTSLSPGRGTPLHVHTSQDEVFHVLEGAYYFQVGEETYKMTAGDVIFLPRKVPHAWTQRSERGKMMVTVQPAGQLEQFFVTMAGLDHAPSPREIENIFAANGMRVVGPPLALP